MYLLSIIDTGNAQSILYSAVFCVGSGCLMGGGRHTVNRCVVAVYNWRLQQADDGNIAPPASMIKEQLKQ